MTRSAIGRIRGVLALLVLAAAPAVVAEPLRFAWPAPAQALVTVEAAKGGHSARSSLRLTVSRDAKGRTRLDFSEAQLLAMDGRVLTDSAAPGAPADLEALMPSLVVGADGRVQEVLGLARLGAAIGAGGEGAQVSAGMRRALASPAVQAQLRERAAEDWRAWVGVWVGRDLAHGARLDIGGAVPGMSAKVQAAGTMTHQGPAAGFPPGAVRLRLDLTAEGPQFRRAVYEGLKAVAGEAGQSLGDLTLERVETASRRQTLELVADPLTLRPYRVDAGTHIVFKLLGQEAQTQSETKSFRFAWQ